MAFTRRLYISRVADLDPDPGILVEHGSGFLGSLIRSMSTLIPYICWHDDDIAARSRAMYPLLK